jgi:large subunit ribosomal protein L25
LLRWRAAKTPPFSIGLDEDRDMASVQQMKATVRPKAGKGAARAARYSGRVPGVIYGENKPPVIVLIEHDELKKRIHAGRFLTTLYELDIEGTKHRVIPRDFQLDALKDLPMHVDFLRVSEGATIRVHIPVHVLNTDQSPGVKRGGAVNIVTHTVEVMCPADTIPESIDVDITGLEISHSKHLSDVSLPPNVKVLGRADMTLVTVVPPSGYAEEMKAAAEAAAAAAAAAAATAPGAEGVAPAAAPGAAPGAAPAAAPGAAPAVPAPEKK